MTAVRIPPPIPIDVRDYGVTADNSTDDTVALQAALDAAITPVTGVSAGNDYAARTVQLPPGRIKITAPLGMPANTILRGHGPAGTYLYYTGGGNTNNVPSATSNAAIRLKTGAEVQCEVRDLGIICSDSTYGTGGDGINFSQTAMTSILGDGRHVIENVVVVGGRYSLIFNSNTENRVRNFGAYRQGGGQVGVAYIGGTDHFFSDVTIAQPTAGNGQFIPGFRVNTANSRFVDVKVFGGAGSGAIYEAGTGARNQWTSIEVQDYNGKGLLVQGPSTVNGVLIDSCGNDAISLGGPGGYTPVVIREARVVNRAGGAYAMTSALDCPNGAGFDVELQVYAPAGGTTPAKLFPNNTTYTGSGNRLKFNNEDGTVSAAYAASYTPDPLQAGKHIIGSLTGGITINNPSSSIVTANYLHVGMELTFVLPQDATGGRTVTWGANYAPSGAIDTTASKTTTIRFLYDGTKWREAARSLT